MSYLPRPSFYRKREGKSCGVRIHRLLRLYRSAMTCELALFCEIAGLYH